MIKQRENAEKFELKNTKIKLIIIEPFGHATKLFKQPAQNKSPKKKLKIKETNANWWFEHVPELAASRFKWMTLGAPIFPASG